MMDQKELLPCSDCDSVSIKADRSLSNGRSLMVSMCGRSSISSLSHVRSGFSLNGSLFFLLRHVTGPENYLRVGNRKRRSRT